MLFEQLCVWIVLEPILPYILPLLEPDKYKQIQWKYQLMGAWVLFRGEITLPEMFRQKILMAGYLQLALIGAGVVTNILKGLV
jgi:hypothetical protein